MNIAGFPCAKPMGRCRPFRDSLVSLSRLCCSCSLLCFTTFIGRPQAECTITSLSMPTEHADENGGYLPKAHGPPTSPRSSEGSPSSLIMARGRSRVRNISSDADPFSEENLRKRCASREIYSPFGTLSLKHTLFFYCTSNTGSGYHSLKSFDQTFRLEKRWKLVREMGSGAYGVVMSVRILSLLASALFTVTTDM